MKQILTLIILFCFSIGFSQDFKQEWKEVVQFELNGKTKSAHEVVNSICKKAKKQNFDDQVIKCFFYQSKFIQVIDENSQDIILKNLLQEIKDSKGSKKALLNFTYVSILERFYQSNSYNINQRTNLKQTESNDFKTWTALDFQKEIDKVYAGLLDDEKELRKTNIKAYTAILDISPYTDTKKLSIYDFLQTAVVNHEFNYLNISNKNKYIKTSPELFKITAEFVKFKTDTITDKTLKRIVELYQHNEKYCLKNNNDDITVLQYNRMKRFEVYFPNKDLYLSKLSALEALTTNAYLLQDIRVDKAKHYFSITSKGNFKNYYPDALSIIETVLNSNENPNAKAGAESLKEAILGKKIILTIPSQLYQSQSYRAFVEFKNIDTLKVSYYKIPLEILKKLEKNQHYYRNHKQIDRDSLVFSYIQNHTAGINSLKIMPANADHFEYTTEILMDKLDLGSYLLFFETKNPSGYPQKKPFAYHTIQVSNLDFVQEKEGNFDAFQVLDRKTGQPIQNVIVKNDDTTMHTDKKGKASFDTLPYEQKENGYSELLFIKEKDTLYSSYYRSVKYKQVEDEEFEAKAMLFFDRAIYRPGQKVYFKGFLLKNLDKIKSVVPFVTVHLIINDANDDEVKTFDIQTNEFGSFTGEYDIPKNVLTGEFSIVIEEPDNYEADIKYYDKEKDEHSFWDNVDYDDYKEFKFKVEEYKRPTFEITFDKIKENYTIGDTITLRGNAKSLAGSNLTQVKVKYTISNSIREKNSYSYSDEEIINSETTTDENGNFKIEFPAKAENDFISVTDIETILYSIKTSITDLNGETRTADTAVTVGDKMLKLDGKIASNIYQEDKSSLQIYATTLNNFPINTRGTITIIERNQNEYLIKKQRFPELYSIDRKEYEAAFPYEAYDEKDIKTRENKVYSLPFDTEKSTVIDFSFLKNFKLGKYKIIVEAKDKKENLITDESNFELCSQNKKASNKTLFTFNQVGNNKDYFVFEVHSVIPDLYITTRMFDDSKKKTENSIQLQKGYGQIKIPKKSNYNNSVQFHFSTIWQNTYYSDLLTINKDEIETKLDFEIRSMRNKIEPGSNENWSFIVKNSKMQSEVLASMYDVSLDQFAINDWEPVKFSNYYPSPNVTHQSTSWYDNTVRFENLYFNTKYYKIFFQEPKLNWFGFDFNSKNLYLNKEYLKKVAPIVGIPKNAKTIHGVIVDKTGPLPGANVMVKGTDRSTQTNFDGYYEIEALPGEVLVFNFIGYNNSTQVVGKDQNININLKEQSDHLDEVIVIGYGTMTKQAFTGTATVITLENKSLLLELASVIPGLEIAQSSGSPRFAIRGFGSVNGNRDPLYVVDGQPVTQEEFLKLNLDEIQNINVLKDASATAIYGSRASNGVIVISTKSSMKELEQVKTRTNFNETAFFYPNLTTDTQGQISFSFTTPESLTKWKLRLFAHNKKAETGYFQTEIISQKDIMVMPNMPRFLREKDTINLAVKVVNLTNEIKSGNAVLLLYDAVTNNAIDAVTLNKNNTKVFSCKPKQSVVVHWKITIPEGVQGLRYKVMAKSGNLSDGEENMLPILTDKVLVTESIPIWVKGNTKREFNFPNLKNNISTTLQNHAFTFEYTSNPVWLALQSLPYLMTYEHDCAEQTFAKYYANCLAEKIISGNPKIESLFKKWQTNKLPESKLKLNEELKSIVLAETPWLMDAESEDERNNRMAILMDLNTMKENNGKALKKVEDLQLASGGFSWFSGGNENRYISQHILSGIGHLNTLFPNDSIKYKNIVSKGIPNLDRIFVSNYTKNKKIFRPTTVNLNYLYVRSFYIKNYPLSKKCDSIIQLQIKNCKEDWLGYSLYEKGLLALIMNRFNEKDFAKKIITSLKETVSNNEEIGMYWIENSNGYDWYQSSIETQALLIEAFAEIDKNKDTLDAMKVWLIKNKQTKNWPTTKATTEAIYALLYHGNDWSSLKEKTKIKIGDEKILIQKLAKKEDELDSGYLKLKFDATEINSKTATITVDNKSTAPGFGGAYWQYFETTENIKADSTKTLFIDKKLYKKNKTNDSQELIALNKEIIKVGDLVTVRLIIKTDNNLEFVHLKDVRASCFEPVDVISGYEWKGNLGYYKSTKDVATNFFFDTISKGTYVLEYDLRVTNTGAFNNGISTLQSMYAPEFGTHSVNTKINVSE